MSAINSIKCSKSDANTESLSFCRLTHTTTPLGERRSWAASRYFTCACIACKENYPLYEDMKHSKINIEAALAGKGKERETYQRVCDVLQKFDSRYPCVELANGKRLISFCFSYVANPSKMSLNRKYFWDKALCADVDLCALFLKSISTEQLR